MPTFAVSTFYRFIPLPECAALRAPLQHICDRHGIKGILLLAPEGLNATLAGVPERLETAVEEIRRHVGCPEFNVRTSFCDALPFLRMKVRLKAEIVTLGVPGTDPNARTGTLVEAEDWNVLLRDPAIPVIDVRNGFEHAIGTFAGAIDPGTASFGDFPTFVEEALDPKRHMAVAMFCTGGIRCEKASAYLLDQGFETVYQLKGGILSYLERVALQESLWQGDCFVFDGRVAVGAGLKTADVALCYGCRWPLTPADRASPHYVEGVSCARCADLRSPEQQAGARERHRQVGLADRRGLRHLGTVAQPTPNLERPAPTLTEVGCEAIATRGHAAPHGARGGGRNESR
ncbi:rhodanese-related sulfurtransferase [Hyphomicrobiales bacterium BP6-180914]|uniref:tRNA uridine(34) hydroxylase n=1 Tax=Lichenifustis flavocetrariae TaxID=2949735 RepID=A0AA41YRU4_9HYPH|nr:rhodanese-related sulfurtransferase [Lichenifustis flavocetrariae]MCW6507371.1 rhodanese-related sulfurtransferase [Lichenifustis flavocetrariae]